MRWIKSSYSGGGNDCVEVAFTPDGTAVRDSKNPEAGHLQLSREHWREVVDAARSGRLDLPR